MTVAAQSLNSLPAFAGKLYQHRSLAIRLVLVAILVAASHLFEWSWLRTFTTSALVAISAALGVPMHRIGSDLIQIGRVQAQFVVSCTAIDAFLGAVALLWSTRLSVQANLARFGVLFLAVQAFNLVRLEAGFVALNYGAPWWLAHECVAGVSYFCLYLFIVRRQVWNQNGLSV